jgi:hypothetical protein
VCEALGTDFEAGAVISFPFELAIIGFTVGAIVTACLVGELAMEIGRGLEPRLGDCAPVFEDRVVNGAGLLGVVGPIFERTAGLPLRWELGDFEGDGFADFGGDAGATTRDDLGSSGTITWESLGFIGNISLDFLGSGILPGAELPKAGDACVCGRCAADKPNPGRGDGDLPPLDGSNTGDVVPRTPG